VSQEETNETTNQEQSSEPSEQTEQTNREAQQSQALPEQDGDVEASTNGNNTGEEQEIAEGVNLMQELIAAQKQAQEYMDGWQRARAEFANYKKRVERDLQDRHQQGGADMLEHFLSIIDDFDRAMHNIPDDLREQHGAWLEGVEMIQRNFQKKLDDLNVTVIDPVGEPFDPNLHEAIGTDDDSDADSGTVTQTLQKGYLYGDRVLRPALVRVAS